MTIAVAVGIAVTMTVAVEIGIRQNEILRVEIVTRRNEDVTQTKNVAVGVMLMKVSFSSSLPGGNFINTSISLALKMSKYGI